MQDPEQIEIIPESSTEWNVSVGSETLALLERLGLTESGPMVRDEAVSVLRKCVPPTSGSGQETGLVVGYIQSGKTLSFTTVTALARDNGYPIVIVIAGTSVPLTEQSHERLRQDLRFDERNDHSWRHLHNPRIDHQHHTRIETTLSDWRDPDVPSSEKSTILITVMKNHIHLAHLIQVLGQVSLEGIPVLIVDDEADQAGLNNLINQGDESTTYQRLCALKAMIPHHTFLQYTATPQGPLLINLIDVLSPGFASTLTPGPDYTGGREFFLEGDQFVRIIPPTEIPSNANVLTEPPDSLLEAARLYFLGVASGLIRNQGQGNRSMMVHPSQRTGGHRQYFDWMTALQNDWKQILENPQDPDYSELVEEFQLSYNDLAQTVLDLEPFEELLPRLLRAIRRTDIHLVNAARGRTPEIDWRGSYSHILVGGQALDRGFTVEGLTVTYMPRGVGTRRADTIQQRARFFGYKRPYLAYCRVYLEQQVADSFQKYVRHEENIRQQLERIAIENRSLDELRRVFLLPQGLYATRDSIIDIDYVRARVNEGWFYPRAPQESPEQGASNSEIVVSFLNTLELDDDEGSDQRTDIQRHAIARDVPLQTAYEQLLLRLRFSRLSDAQDFLGVLVILRDHLVRNPDSVCTIYEMSHGLSRLRTLDLNGEIPNLFQGAAPVTPRERRGEVYPGDREIRSASDVTIQIHTLDLADRVSGNVIHEDVPNVAIWIPAGIAGDVLIQDQGGPQEATDD